MEIDSGVHGGGQAGPGAWSGQRPADDPPEGETASGRAIRIGHDIGEEIAELAAHLDAATHRLLLAVRAFEDSGAWAAQGFQTCAGWLSWRVGWSIGVARERLRVARRLTELPLVDDALRRGELSYCKARAITRVATPAIEAALVEDARYTTGAQLETLCRKYASVQRAGSPDAEFDDLEDRYVRRRVRHNGMVMIEASLHAEEAEVVWEALTQLARAQASPGGVG